MRQIISGVEVLGKLKSFLAAEENPAQQAQVPELQAEVPRGQEQSCRIHKSSKASGRLFRWSQILRRGSGNKAAGRCRAFEQLRHPVAHFVECKMIANPLSRSRSHPSA